MKKRLLTAAALFAAVMMIVTAAVYVSGGETERADENAAVALNEIDALYRNGQVDKAHERAAALAASLQEGEGEADGDNTGLLVLCALSLVFMAGVLSYVYFTVLRPFDKLSSFADRVAAGDLETPLKLERGSYFGKFTWAFDSMRSEITKARACEREAIDNNKTVIATLSHDIKTPVASIRAYAEALDSYMDKTPEKRRKYISVIMRKCDEVSRLTNDLFLHSLSDLERLKVVCERVELAGFMRSAVDELSAGKNDLHLTAPNSELYVNADPARLMQVCENLINNSRKYAATDIDIELTEGEESAVITITDSGSGINDHDMPFIFDKFYRGKNSADRPGSGLGLYIVKYLTTQMGGEITLRNLKSGGLEARITLALTADR